MNVIHLLLLGDADVELATGLNQRLTGAFHCPVTLHDNRIDIEAGYDAVRAQYNATVILDIVRRLSFAPDTGSGGKIVAVIPNDLFIPILTFVFGEAELNGRCAVVSYHRLQNEVYGLEPDRRLLELRLQKEVIHELGHTYGLLHCHEYECVMHASSSVEEIDLKGADFCLGCTLRLKSAAANR